MSDINSDSRRRTQAERRTESRQAVLSSAVRLFGEKGYADASLEEIAADCSLTIRPIYHYFGNKKALFAAVNEVMEQRIIAAMGVETGTRRRSNITDNWRAYLDLCDDPAFRRIVLIDSPNVLGRERWSASAVSEKARITLGLDSSGSEAEEYRGQLLNAAVLGAFAEAALMIADANDISMAKREAERVMVMLFSDLFHRL